jgi:hypothetical protein
MHLLHLLLLLLPLPLHQAYTQPCLAKLAAKSAADGRT